MLPSVVGITWWALDLVQMILLLMDTFVGPTLPKLLLARLHLFNTFRVSESNSTPYLQPPRAVFNSKLCCF